MIDVSKPVPSKALRPHWVCHFDFHDGPLNGLVEIDGQNYVAQVLDGSNVHRKYSLTPIVLTDEASEYLDDYWKSYRHCFYAAGVRPAYDGRPLGWFADKWGRRNPVRELAVKREE